MGESPLRVWLMASRPKTLWAAVAPVVIGTAMALDADGFHLWSALAALFGAVMIQVGTNFANDYFDFKAGGDDPDRLGPTRVTQAGLVAPSTMKVATAIAFGLALMAGVYLVWRGGMPIVVIGLLSITLGMLYTTGPFPLAYNGLADIFVLVFFGPVAVGGTYYVQTLTINPAVILIGLAPGLFSVAILTVNNLRDVKSDTRSGRRTLAIRFGVGFAKIEYLLSLLIASLLPLGLFFTNGDHLYSILTVLVMLPAMGPIKRIFTAEGAVLNDVLASTGKLLLLFSLIFSVGWLV